MSRPDGGGVGSEATTSRWGSLVWLLVAFLAALPSVPTLGAGWIAEDTSILNYVARRGPLEDFLQPQYDLQQIRFWRPVTTLSWWVQQALFGVHPVPFRLLNLALHVGCALLAFGLVRRIGGTKVGALLAGVLTGFFAHQGGTVTWVAGRVDLWGVFGILVGVHVALSRVRLRWLWAALAAYLACAGKEVAFIVPGWVVAFAWARGEEPRQVVRTSLPTVVGFLVAFVWRRVALGTWVGGYPVQPLGFGETLAGVPLALGRALGWSLLGAGLLCALGSLAGLVRWRWVTAGLVAFLCAVVPHLPLLAPGELSPQNVRMLFACEVALALVVGAAIGGRPAGAALHGRPGLALPLAAAALGLVAWHAVGAFRDAAEWREAGAEGRRREAWVRRVVEGAAAGEEPVLVPGFPPAHGGAYCMGLGVAERFTAPFPPTPRPIWPLRALSPYPPSQRTPALPPRPDGTLWPLDDASVLPVLAVTASEGLPIRLDARVLSGAGEPPWLTVTPPAGATAEHTLEVLVYSSSGYEPGLLGALTPGAPRHVSLREVLGASNGVYNVGQALQQSADFGARRAYLELRCVAPDGRVVAVSSWQELVWPPDFLARSLGRAD